MSENRKVHFIPPMPVKRQQKVGSIAGSVQIAWNN